MRPLGTGMLGGRCTESAFKSLNDETDLLFPPIVFSFLSASDEARLSGVSEVKVVCGAG